MNRLLLLLIAIVVLITTHLTHPRIGCRANSYYLQERYDTKELHPVACNCDCAYHQARGNYNKAQNQCLACTHFYYPHPLIFLTKLDMAKKVTNAADMPDARFHLQRLIERYKQHVDPSCFDN
jgi:hypothetical protein